METLDFSVCQENMLTSQSLITSLEKCKCNGHPVGCDLTILFLCPQHPFVSQPLSRTLAIELLDKASNPDHTTYNDFDDDDPEPEVQSPPQPLQLQFYPIK